MEEVPEKIYVSIHSGIHHYEQKNDDDIEYTRTDVFIKKIEEYLKNNFVNDVSVLAGGIVHINFSTAIENFIKYMKGERVMDDAELLVRSLPGVHFREDNHNWITIREDTLVQAIEEINNGKEVSFI